MIELLNPEEMGRADAATVAAGTPVATLMERAGYAVADIVAAQTPFGTPILVLAGPGNNGGDAFVAAEVLRERGYKVSLADLSNGAGSPAARHANARYRGQRVGASDVVLKPAQVVVDGLFGGGLARAIEGEAATLVKRVNESGARVFAIDLPSGVNGASGAVVGPAIRAERTITFERRKPGHYLAPGRALTGRLSVAEIGIRARTIADLNCRTFANEPDLWRAHRPRLLEAGHKYDRGHVLVLSGPITATGAARLAAMAALRAGAGLVTLASPKEALLVNAAHLTTVMLTRLDEASELADIVEERRITAIALGPGLPPDDRTAAVVKAALATGRPTLLDAGALTAFAPEPAALFEALQGATAVLTPHAGEFARLFASDAAKLERGRAAALQAGCPVVEKGQDTVICAPDGRAAINHNAPPSLATAGSGDVLAGVIAAFLAAGAPPFEAAAMGVWLHGETATRAGPALIADDLLGALRSTRAAFDDA